MSLHDEPSPVERERRLADSRTRRDEWLRQIRLKKEQEAEVSERRRRISSCTGIVVGLVLVAAVVIRGRIDRANAIAETERADETARRVNELEFQANMEAIHDFHERSERWIDDTRKEWEDTQTKQREFLRKFHALRNGYSLELAELDLGRDHQKRYYEIDGTRYQEVSWQVGPYIARVDFFQYSPGETWWFSNKEIDIDEAEVERLKQQADFLRERAESMGKLNERFRMKLDAIKQAPID